ncbi:MAG: T9SS type A sorting domain-containing protein [Bacteroidales bacterium]|jgi:hypothetical protein
MKKIIYILAIVLFYLPQARSQGVTNNGSYIKIYSGNLIKLTGNTGNFVNATSGALNGKVQNDGRIYVQGKWLNNVPGGNLFINRNGIGEVIFNGTAMQTIGGTQTTYFENLRINNTYGTSPQIKIGINTNVDNQLSMMDGNINLAGYTLALGNAPGTPGTLSHAGTAASGWMYGGNFTRYFNASTIADRNVAGMFPLGSSTNFRPFYVSHPVTALTSGGTITLSHTSATTATSVSFADGISTVVRRDNSYWTVSTAGIAVGGTPFNLSEEGTGFGSVSNVTDLRATLVASVAGTAGTNSGTTLDPQINRTGLSLLNLTNNFYPASVNISSPLPIELISFFAVCNGDKVNLNWATASETNNDYFTILRSKDGISFEEALRMNGAGNSNTILNYSATDYNPYDGISYYRLKQTDYNGNAASFNIVLVNCLTGSEPSVTIYPNPFSTHSTILISDASQFNNYQLEIYNVLGTEIMSTIITNQSTVISNLSTGVYFYKVISNGKIIQSGKLISTQ